MYTAHMDRFEGCSGTGGVVSAMEVDRLVPPPERPEYVPGVMWPYGRPTESTSGNNYVERFGGLPLQPGEVSVRSHHAGRGPVPPERDCSLHPAARPVTALSVEVCVVMPDQTYSGCSFDGIAFGD